MSSQKIPAETTSALSAECGDLMLARECVADLKAARFRGETSLNLSHSVEELERRSYGFGSPIGESSGRGAMIGGVLGLALSATLSSLPAADLPISFPLLASLMCTLCAALGGIVGFFARKRSLAGRTNGRGITLRCIGDASEITRALETLQRSPCCDIRVHVRGGALVTA